MDSIRVVASNELRNSLVGPCRLGVVKEGRKEGIDNGRDTINRYRVGQLACAAALGQLPERMMEAIDRSTDR